MKLRPPAQFPIHAFTLVEVTISMGVVAVALVSLMGLLPFGLTTFRQAMTNTVESQIVQGIANEVLLAEFANLEDLAGQEYSFDEEGKLLKGTSDSASLYKATLQLKPLNNLQAYPVNLQTTGSQNEGYNVQIQITNRAMPDRKTTHSMIVANNNI